MLAGRFHSHITVDGPLEDIMRWSRDNKGKFTYIQLEKGLVEQVDVMGTFYARFDVGVTKEAVFGHFNAIAENARGEGLTVKRLKVEVDKVPNYCADGVNAETVYWEGHIKLDLAKDFDLESLKRS